MANELLYTPLTEWHKSHGAKMGAFAGWDMPIQYPTGIITEHINTRTKAGLFDICHMGELIIEGKGALEALAKAVTINFDTLKTGRCRYGFLLNDSGGIIDDLIIYRIEDDKFMVVTNAGCRDIDKKLIQERIGANFTVRDISNETAKLDIQGPESVAIMESLLPGTWRIPYFSMTTITFDNAPLLVSRTGYTGELGFELYAPMEKALMLWELCLSDKRVMPVGLGARDTLRLEAGLPLNGNDITEKHTPCELGYGSMLTSTAAYTGKDGAQRVTQQLVPLAIPGRRSARHGDKVLNSEGNVVGEVTSGSYSPCLEHVIALAYIDAEKGTDQKYTIDTGKASLEATVTTLPFYTKGTARNPLS